MEVVIAQSICHVNISSIEYLYTGSFFQGSDRILLNDLKVLTLHHGQMTTAHRSSPIPQLKCLGGSAQCSFTPQTVQCYNKGSDGYDVQVTYLAIISSGTGIPTPSPPIRRCHKSGKGKMATKKLKFLCPPLGCNEQDYLKFCEIQSLKCDSIVSGLNYTDVH